MKRLFWFLVGFGLGVMAVLRGRQLLQRFTPAGVAEQVETIGKRGASDLADFFATIKQAMAEREEELKRTIDNRETAGENH